MRVEDKGEMNIKFYQHVHTESSLSGKRNKAIRMDIKTEKQFAVPYQPLLLTLK